MHGQPHIRLNIYLRSFSVEPVASKAIKGFRKRKKEIGSKKKIGLESFSKTIIIKRQADAAITL